MKKKMSKAKCEAIHFKRRLKERFGIKINRLEYLELCFEAKKLPSIKQQSIRVSLRELTIHGKKVPVVYDKKTGKLVSALPENAFNNT